MKRKFCTLAVTVACTALTAGSSTAQAQRETCQRPPVKQLAEGATIVLTETVQFPCVLQFVNTGIVLKADNDGTVEDVSFSVARGPDGRYYTSNGRSGQVTVWNPDGSYLRNFGTRGEGPGEFSAAGKTILFDRSGRLLIGNNNKWMYFSNSYSFISGFAASALNSAGGNTATLLEDGTFLSGRGENNLTYIIYDLASLSPAGLPAKRAFGAAPASGTGTRIISYAGGTTFWSASPGGPGFRYEIELWRTDGTRLRTIRRDVPWIPITVAGEARGRMPPPEMEVMHVDSSGLIIVTIVTANKSFLTLSPEALRSSDINGAMGQAIDIFVEVIDANAGVVLASTGPIRPAEAMATMPTGYLPGSRTGYRREEDANGLPFMRIVEARLMAR